MAGKSRATSPWTNPDFEPWVREHAPDVGWHSSALWLAFCDHFGMKVELAAFRLFASRLRDGGHVIPAAPVPDLNESIVRLPWKTVLITSDFQIPAHDADLIAFAYDLGEAWDVDGHVLNGDIYDFGMMSKFKASLPGQRVTAGDELEIGAELINLAVRRHKRAILIPGNHEWRIYLAMLEGQLHNDQVKRLLAANDQVAFTPLSYCLIDGYGPDQIVRVTHPGAASVIAGTVGADIARNHQQHVVVAHDHMLCYRRSHSGAYFVVHSGMMADPGRIDYAMTKDSRRPRMNQGFVILHPDANGKPCPRLIDPLSCDRDLEMWIAERYAKTRKTPKEAAA